MSVENEVVAPVVEPAEEVLTPLDLDATVHEESVTIKIKGVPVCYILTEASSEVAFRYRDLNMKIVAMDDGKPSGLKQGNSSFEAVLVSGCLFSVDSAGKRKNVPEGEIRQWPHRITETLAERIKKVSPTLMPKSKKAQGGVTDAAGKPPSDSTSTSESLPN